MCVLAARSIIATVLSLPYTSRLCYTLYSFLFCLLGAAAVSELLATHIMPGYQVAITHCSSDPG